MDVTLPKTKPTNSMEHGSNRAPLLPLQKNSSFHLLSPLLSIKNIYVALGPLACLLICLFVDVKGKNMLGALAWVFIWWLTEAVPVPVTSIAPFYLLPVLGVSSADVVAKCYMNDVIALVLGSFILAIAVEDYNIHQHVALKIILMFCGEPPNVPLLLLGICGTTVFISFWMQNTAAAVMMMPVAMGILHHLEDKDDDREVHPDVERFGKAVVLGVMYSAAIGGIATATGTGVNLITVGMWATYFPDEDPISFSSWFMFGFPLAMVMFLALWATLCFLYCSKSSGEVLAEYLDKNRLRRELELLGPMAFAEKTILSVFGVLVVLWMTRTLTDDFPGWGTLFDDKVGDGTVSVLMATLLFIIPSKKKQGEKLMDWNKCKKLHWNVILLLGAGFAIADGVRSSGLADMLSNSLSFLNTVPHLLLPPLVCLLSSIITEFASNNAAATLVDPILIELAKSIGVHPLMLMISGSIGAEYAYWLPTGTPSNAVGFATGRVGFKDMIKIGMPLKVVGIIALGVLMPTLGVLAFGISGRQINLKNT